MHISADMTVEELIEIHPKVAGFLSEKGIVCVRCGEPYWGTLRELAGHKGLENQVDQLVSEMVEQLQLRDS